MSVVVDNVNNNSDNNNNGKHDNNIRKQQLIHRLVSHTDTHSIQQCCWSHLQVTDTCLSQ